MNAEHVPVPVLQYGRDGFEQCVSMVQFVRHAVPLQMKSPQLVLTVAHAEPVHVDTFCEHALPRQLHDGPLHAVVVCAEQSPLLHVVTGLRCVPESWQLAPGHMLPVFGGVLPGFAGNVQAVRLPEQRPSQPSPSVSLHAGRAPTGAPVT